MKPTLLRIIATAVIAATPVIAHEGIKIGPNGGRLFTLASKTTPHMEVAAKDGSFVVRLLDEKREPIPLGDRTLTIIAGERANPEKLIGEKAGETFTAPIPKGRMFPVVLQLREAEGGKPLTARMNYNTAPCPECKEPEWLCTCVDESKK